MDEEKKKGLMDWVNDANEFSVYQDPNKVSSGLTQADLITRIMLASSMIANKSNKSLGDYIVTSPEIADLLRQMDPKVKLRKKRLEKLNKLNEIWKKDKD